MTLIINLCRRCICKTILGIEGTNLQGMGRANGEGEQAMFGSLRLNYNRLELALFRARLLQEEADELLRDTKYVKAVQPLPKMGWAERMEKENKS